MDNFLCNRYKMGVDYYFCVCCCECSPSVGYYHIYTNKTAYDNITCDCIESKNNEGHQICDYCIKELVNANKIIVKENEDMGMFFILLLKPIKIQVSNIIELKPE